MFILAQQQGAVLHGQVNELLVVCVFAGQAGFGGGIYDAAVLVKLGEYFVCGELIEGQANRDFGVRQHPGQFIAHGLGGEPVEVLFGKTLADWFGGGVVENENVQDDVRVKDDCLDGHGSQGAGRLAKTGSEHASATLPLIRFHFRQWNQ
jgi:hypothetical protein